MAVVKKTKVWHGSPTLARSLVEISDLTPHPRNRRRGDVERIARSLQEFGQLKPVVITADLTILAGHHVWQAAQTLGWTHVAVARADLDEHAAQTFLIADNRLSDIASYDDAGLVADLHELGLDQALIAGYTREEIERLEERVRLDGIEPPPDVETSGGGKTVTCPACGHGFVA